MTEATIEPHGPTLEEIIALYAVPRPITVTWSTGDYIRDDEMGGHDILSCCTAGIIGLQHLERSGVLIDFDTGIYDDTIETALILDYGMTDYEAYAFRVGLVKGNDNAQWTTDGVSDTENLAAGYILGQSVRQHFIDGGQHDEHLA